MTDNTVWVACASGPASKKANVEVALELAGIPLLPEDHHAQMDWQRKLAPIPSVFAVACPTCGEPAGERCKTRGKTRDEHHQERVHAFEHPAPQAFLAVAHPDIDQVVTVVAKHDWALRTHHEMPPEPEPDPMVKLTATLAEMRAEIDALKARG